MYVCICNAITDKQIIEAQQNGYANMEQITRHLGVGNCCGRCVTTAQEVLNDNKVNTYIPQLFTTSVMSVA